MRHSFPQGKTGRTGLQIVRYFCCSVAQLCPLQPHWLQLARFLCPSLSLRICSNSRESMMPFSHLILCCPLLLPSIFPSIKVMSRLFAPGGQSTGASVLSMNIQGWFPLGLTGWISVLQCSAFFMVWLPHLYMTTGKTIALTMQTFVSKVMTQLFNMLSRLVIAFLPSSVF